MAVGFRAAGAWQDGATGLTADEVVAIPAAQVTGDMILIVACWKDFAITAQVSGYSELFELADGTVGTGNGLGSMKVGIWYKVALSDAESDPTVDFSTTTGLLGEATCVVFSKAGGDSWNTPTFVVGAINTWGTGGGTTSASSTITVPSGGAVVGIAAIRDDSATFTRGNTAIDDAGSLVTWNGNYAEQPATHASTTTGNDMACDAGYRLVTTGAAGVTLRQTGTLSATETGQAAWVVLGTFTPDPKTAVPTAGSMTATGSTPTIRLNIRSQPTAASMTATGATPTVAVTAHQVAQPTAASMAASGATPIVATPVVSLPTSSSMVATGDTPEVTAGQGTVAIPDAAAMTATGSTPTVSTSDHISSQPTAGAMAATGATPAISLPIAAIPTSAAMASSLGTPTVTASDHKTSVPTAASMTATPATPLVEAVQVYEPTAAALDLETSTPTVAVTENQLVLPSVAEMELTGAIPVMGGPVTVEPTAASLAFSFGIPLVLAPVEVHPDAAAMATAFGTPFVEAISGVVALPTPGLMVLTGASPPAPRVPDDVNATVQTSGPSATVGVGIGAASVTFSGPSARVDE